MDQYSNKAVHWRVLTVGDLRDFLNGSSDIATIEWLQVGADVRLVSNPHAKVHITADRSRAVMTSANLTLPGFEKNLELGVFLDDVEEVTALMRVVNKWFSQGKQADLQPHEYLNPSITFTINLLF